MFSKEILLNLDEAALRRDVLLPLFRAMGFHDVVEYHGGTLEQGKDIVMWRNDATGNRVNYAVVVKAKPISGRASGSASAAEVSFQIQQCFGTAYLDSAGPGYQTVHHCYVVCPHELKTEALQALNSSLSGAGLERITNYLCGNKLWQLIDEHLSEKTLLARADAIRRALQGSPDQQGTELFVSQKEIRIRISPPRRLNPDDNIIRAVFEFPHTAEGKAAKEALETHVRSGAPATIPGEYIKEFSVPDYFARLGFDKPASLEMFPLTRPSILLNVEMASHVGTVRVENLPFTGRAETDEIFLESATPEQPWRISLRFISSKRETSFSIHVDYEGLNVKRQLEAMTFEQALCAGGILRVEIAQTGQIIANAPVEAQSFGVSQPQHVVDLLQTLLAIQERTGKLFSLPMGLLKAADVAAAEAVLKALRGEVVKRRIAKMTFSIVPEGREQLLEAARSGEALMFTRAGTEEISVFGTMVPMGTVVEAVEGLRLTPESVTELSRARDSNQTTAVEVTLVGPATGQNTEAKYVDWLPPDEANRIRTAYGLVQPPDSSEPAIE
jgi:hypothetical protein